MPSLFISFEGGEGAGKSTQIASLKKRLDAFGDVVVTREPGGTDGAEAIRTLLVEGDPYKWDGLTETVLHFAARLDHVKKIIEPALKSGKFVLSDRFFDSTYAYQGYGQGVPIAEIDKLRELTIGQLKPDITFLLDLDIETGLKRVAVEQRYERMGTHFHEKLRRGFLDLAEKDPNRFVIIDAKMPLKAVEDAIWEAVQKRL